MRIPIPILWNGVEVVNRKAIWPPFQSANQGDAFASPGHEFGLLQRQPRLPTCRGGVATITDHYGPLLVEQFGGRTARSATTKPPANLPPRTQSRPANTCRPASAAVGPVPVQRGGAAHGAAAFPTGFAQRGCDAPPEGVLDQRVTGDGFVELLQV